MFRQCLWAVVIMLLWPAGRPLAQAPNVVTKETTVKATVDRIERSIRVVTFRQDGNVFQSIYVDPTVATFDDLKVGDLVTVRYVESVIVQVRPGAELSDLRDSTEEAKKAGQDQVIQQTEGDRHGRGSGFAGALGHLPHAATIAGYCVRSTTSDSSRAFVPAIASR